MIQMKSQSRSRLSEQVEVKVQSSVVDLHSVSVMLAREYQQEAQKVQLDRLITSVLWEDLEDLEVL